MISLDNLTVSYGGWTLFDNISFLINPKDRIGLVGRNGAGKTTLIKTIMGLVQPKSGAVLYDGQDISHIPAHKRAEMGIGYVPEGRHVFGRLTVEENLAIGAYSSKDKEKLKKNIEMVYDIFPRLGERREKMKRTMSGGEQQMLAIGRALTLSPRLLLIDEVSMGLMPIMVNTCFKVIHDLNKNGITVLVVEQNANKALKVANRGYVLETGKIVLSDTAENLRGNNVVQNAYLGA